MISIFKTADEHKQVLPAVWLPEHDTAFREVEAFGSRL